MEEGEPSPTSDSGAARVRLRALREGDVEEVVAVYRRAYGDARPIDAEELLGWLRNPEVRRDWLRVLEVDGRVAGYGDIEIVNGRVALEVAAPGYCHAFLEWAEEMARAGSVRGVRVLSYAGRELADAATVRGYRFWRSAYTMRIELGADTPTVSEGPPGIAFRPFREGDADHLRAALDEAFALDPFYHQASPAYFREFYLHARGSDPSLWLLAWANEELAGFVLGFAEHSGDRTFGKVKSLGVRPRWRGRGLGESLLRRAFRELHARGLRAIELGVDAGNETGAVRLYERVGMHVVRRADNWAVDL